MKYHFIVALAGAFALALSLVSSVVSLAQAQELPIDLPDAGGFEIEEDSGASTDWSRYIGGTIGAVTADGDTVTRQLAALQLDIDLPANDRLKTVISVDFADFENSYTQELREGLQTQRQNCIQISRNATPIDEPVRPGAAPDRNNFDTDAAFATANDQHMMDVDSYNRDISLFGEWQNNDCENLVNADEDGYLPVEDEISVADSFVDFREAYVQWEATDFATLTLGRQNLVWGQFEFLSPVGFMLPFRGTNTSPRPTRADLAYAQDAVNLSLFPTGNSELQFIHVPQMRLDPSVEENLKSYSQIRYCERDDAGNFINCDANTEFPDIADYDMSALRYTYYGERLIFAITALDGTQISFDPYREARLIDDGSYTNYTDDDGLVFDTLETVALEFSYVLNLNWTLKGEYTAFETREAADPTYDNGQEGQRNAMGRAIIAVNSGKPYITNDETFIALGFEYEGEDWFGHFQIVNFEFEPAGQADAVLECIEELGTYDEETQTCSGAQDEDDNDGVAPIFFLGRRLGEADDGFVGFGATAFFNAYGAGFFGGWRLNESMEFGAFVGAVVDITDSGPPSDENYDSIDDGDALAQIGVSYLF